MFEEIFGMVVEENIVRSTIYCPRYLHNKAKEAGINISRELTNYLETILFGDNVMDVNYQLDQLRDKKKILQIELTTVNSRIEELNKLVDEHDVKITAEKNLYDKFLNHCKGHIKNSMDNNLPLNVKRLGLYWNQDYFSGNGLNEKSVLRVIDCVKKQVFSFDDFQSLRRGDDF